LYLLRIALFRPKGLVVSAVFQGAEAPCSLRKDDLQLEYRKDDLQL
jgi:hypothetical protein